MHCGITLGFRMSLPFPAYLNHGNRTSSQNFFCSGLSKSLESKDSQDMVGLKKDSYYFYKPTCSQGFAFVGDLAPGFSSEPYCLITRWSRTQPQILIISNCKKPLLAEKNKTIKTNSWRTKLFYHKAWEPER